MVMAIMVDIITIITILITINSNNNMQPFWMDLMDSEDLRGVIPNMRSKWDRIRSRKIFIGATENALSLMEILQISRQNSNRIDVPRTMRTCKQLKLRSSLRWAHSAYKRVFWTIRNAKRGTIRRWNNFNAIANIIRYFTPISGLKNCKKMQWKKSNAPKWIYNQQCHNKLQRNAVQISRDRISFMLSKWDWIVAQCNCNTNSNSRHHHLELNQCILQIILFIDCA